MPKSVLASPSCYSNSTVAPEQEYSHPLLPTIAHPSDIASLSTEQLERLAQELRHKIITTTAATGGHLAPSLGVVELTLAMLSVFNPAHDKIVWDVGHQAYAYKLLTGRHDTFHSLRQWGGISGFPKRTESPFDHFGTGHASTSISAALGMALARDLQGEQHHVISVIGDGALTSGLAFEGMNQAGSCKRPFIVILNDNEMSIAKNVGALSLFMSRNLSARWVRRVKREVEGFLQSIPGIGDDLYEIAKRSKHSFKNFFTPGILFEALNFNYIGAVNGHNISDLQQVLRLASDMEKPVLVHVLTQKGKGYLPAENNPIRFHGVSKFNPATGEALSTASLPQKTYTDIFGMTLCQLAQEDERTVAITAAMPEGTGLLPFATSFPERFFDVGICEQHAVTFAAGLATQGYKPYVAIYATFLQRAYDQIVHDICLQQLPVTFCIDRAGLVGEDGPTHHGVFDIAFLRHIPHMVFMAPKNAAELQQALYTAQQHEGPFAIRYPRGAAQGAPLTDNISTLPIGRGEWIQRQKGSIGIIAIGNSVLPAQEAAQLLEQQHNISCSVLNARWVKPLPEIELKEMLALADTLIVVEEHALAGGFGSAVLEHYADTGQLSNKKILRLGIPDAFIEHGDAGVLRKELMLDAQGLASQILSCLAP